MHSIANAILPGVEVFLLHPRYDGVQQMMTLLAQWQQVVAVHLFAPGEPGRLYLGKGELSLATLNRYAQSPDWFPAFAHLDLLLYSDTVAQGAAGTAFLRQLHTLTGANLGVLSPSLGNPSCGHDWELKLTIGAVLATPPFEKTAIAAFSTR